MYDASYVFVWNSKVFQILITVLSVLVTKSSKIHKKRGIAC